MYFKPFFNSVDITEKVIEEEWDNIAEYRDNMIQSGKDISLLDVTEPYIMDCIGQLDKDVCDIIDCGCGTGHLSYLMSQKLAKRITGIDLSGKSIIRANKNYGHLENLFFIKSSIIDYCLQSQMKFDVCVANMVLMDIIDLNKNIEAISNILKHEGKFCFTITHPWFWAEYWNYKNMPWFDYNTDIFIKAPFKASGYSSEFITTHVHRSLNRYTTVLKQFGFKILDIKELYPINSHLELCYKYDYPRFMGFLCMKQR